MKKIAAVFAMAALSACDYQSADVMPSPLTSHMQTMLHDTPGSYTIIPASAWGGSPEISGLFIRMNEQPAGNKSPAAYCVQFRIIAVKQNAAGDYMLPYSRLTTGQLMPVVDSRDQPLKDYRNETLLNLAEKYVHEKDADNPYSLSQKKTVVCGAMPRP
ncbi:MAG: hypothetical protein JWO78_2105 [Micavibrio sp.]|nr:hypothetical protein [Micavibrio sp.]